MDMCYSSLVVEQMLEGAVEELVEHELAAQEAASSLRRSLEAGTQSPAFAWLS